MNYIRLFTDDDGESRFEDLEFMFAPRDFAPPAPPIDVSETMSASAFMMLRFPAGWTDPAHPAPARQFMIIVSGLLESSAGGDGFLHEAGIESHFGQVAVGRDQLPTASSICSGGIRIWCWRNNHPHPLR